MLNTLATYLLITAATTAASSLGAYVLMRRRDSIRKAKVAAEAEQQRLRDDALVQGVSLATTSMLRCLLQANVIGSASSNVLDNGSALSASRATLHTCDERADGHSQPWGEALVEGQSSESDRRNCVSAAKSRVFAFARRLLPRDDKR